MVAGLIFKLNIKDFNMKIIKILPPAVYIKIEDEKVTPENIINESINVDAGQIWKDSVKYGRLDYQEVSLKEAQSYGYFTDENIENEN